MTQRTAFFFTSEKYVEIKPLTSANSSSEKAAFTSDLIASNNSVRFALFAKPIRATSLHFSIANSYTFAFTSSLCVSCEYTRFGLAVEISAAKSNWN